MEWNNVTVDSGQMDGDHQMLFKIFSSPFECQIERGSEDVQIELIEILEKFVPKEKRSYSVTLTYSVCMTKCTVCTYLFR